MPLNIPLPNVNQFGDFGEVFSEIQKNKLMEAQRQHALAQSSQSQMIQKLLGGNTNDISTNNQSNLSNKNSSTMDANKALMLSGILKLPTQVIDGNLITSFGSFPVGESPSEKGKRSIAENLKKKAGETDIETQQALQNQAEALIGNLEHYDKLDRILSENPNVTGLLSGFAAKHGFEYSPGASDFKSTSGALQLGINKAISQRGGVQSFKSAATIKPDLGNQPKFNKGMIKSGLQDTLSDLSVINDRYKSITGKNIPQYEKALKKYIKQENQEKSNSSVNSSERALVVEHEGKKYVHINGKWEPV